MGELGIGVALLIIGLLAGAIGGALLGGGAAAGAGAATGITTGICSTMRAAHDLDFLTSQQVDQVLDKAARDMSGQDALGENKQVVGSAEACTKFMEKFGRQ